MGHTPAVLTASMPPIAKLVSEDAEGNEQDKAMYITRNEKATDREAASMVVNTQKAAGDRLSANSSTTAGPDPNGGLAVTLHSGCEGEALAEAEAESGVGKNHRRLDAHALAPELRIYTWLSAPNKDEVGASKDWKEKQDEAVEKHM